MKREIKFRVWAKAFKPPRFVKLDEMQCFNGQTWGDIFRKTDDSLFEFQQYTGLRDKHNREIYEGDIIEFDGRDMKRGIDIRICREVIFDDGCFGFEGTISPCVRQSQFDCDYYKFEIIGNIFENPDLIK